MWPVNGNKKTGSGYSEGKKDLEFKRPDDPFVKEKITS